MALILVLVWGPAGGVAQGSSFDRLVAAGAEAYGESDYAGALRAFEEAYGLDPVPALLYNMGRACEAMADFTQAVNYYTLFARSPEIDHEARSDALDRIKTLKEVMSLKPVAPAGIASARCVDINGGSASQLEELPGIGPTRATAIIQERESKGPYKSVDDLTRVHGIGAKTVEKMRERICPIAAVEEVAAGSGSAPVPVELRGVAGASGAVRQDGRVNINTASVDELVKIPSIGKVKAGAIIKEREANGPFRSCEEITRVSGIGVTSLEQILPMCAVD